MSKCGSVAGFRTSVHMHGVPEGDGRWWWALNGCTNQPEGGPLGSVAGQNAPRSGMGGDSRAGGKERVWGGRGGGWWGVRAGQGGGGRWGGESRVRHGRR